MLARLRANHRNRVIVERTPLYCARLRLALCPLHPVERPLGCPKREDPNAPC